TAGAGNAAVTDIQADPGDVNRFYAGVKGQGVYVSTNGGSSWNSINSAAMIVAGADVNKAERIELAVSQATAGNSNHPLYAAIIQQGIDQLVGAPADADELTVPSSTVIDVGDEVTIKGQKAKVKEKQAFLGGVTKLTLDKDLSGPFTTGDIVSTS